MDATVNDHAKRTLYLKRVNLSIDKPLNKKLTQYFENVDNFFSEGNEVIIGKKIKITPINEGQECKDEVSLLSGKKPVKRKKQQPQCNNKTLITQQEGYSLENFADQALNANTKYSYLILDNERIRKYMDQIKANIDLNKTTENNNFQLIMKKLPISMQTNLRYQQKTLSLKQLYDRDNKLLSQKLCKITKKKPENLMLNSTDKFIVKKQLLKSINNRLPIIQRYGRNNWYASLRRGENFKGRRKFNLNFGSDKNPFWSAVEETIPRPIEMAVHSEAKNDNKKEIAKIAKIINNKTQDHCEEMKYQNIDSYFSKDTYFNTIDKFKSLNSIQLKGKNIFKLEYQNAIDMKGKIYIKKDINKNNDFMYNKMKEEINYTDYDKY